jgi:hypothetical protein
MVACAAMLELVPDVDADADAMLMQDAGALCYRRKVGADLYG